MSDQPPTSGPMFDRTRPYDGQPHTDHGERGSLPLVLELGAEDKIYGPITKLEGITLRDIYDAVIIGILQAKNRSSTPVGMDALPPNHIMSNAQLWEELSKDADFDPIAAAQNASCEIEKRLGIFPNVSALTWAENNPQDHPQNFDTNLKDKS